MPSEALAPLAPNQTRIANDIRPLEAAVAPLFHPSPEEMVFAAAAPGDIRDMVEAPCRSLEVEYKSWRNLDHAEDRAVAWPQ